MHRLPSLLALFLFMAFLHAAPVFAAHEFPWLSPFEEGRVIDEILPAGIVKIDYATIKASLAGQSIDLIILDGGGADFKAVSIGFYDKDKRDVTPLWSSAKRESLPYTIEKPDFNELFIKYSYLPGDKYVSCNFKIAVDASFGSEKSKIKAFVVERAMDYAGASLKAGDFILASDSGADGSLSNMSNGDYNDLVFVVSIRQSPDAPLARTLFGIGGVGILGVTLWSIQRGRKGLRVYTL